MSGRGMMLPEASLPLPTLTYSKSHTEFRQSVSMQVSVTSNGAAIFNAIPEPSTLCGEF